MFFWYIFFIILAFLQSTVLPLDFLLLLVISLSVIVGQTKTLQLVFWTGLLLDFLLMHRLGQTAIFYLFISVVVMLYGKKFHGQNPVFLLFYTALVSFLENILFLGKVNQQSVILQIILILPLFFASKFLQEFLNSKNYQQLKLEV